MFTLFVTFLLSVGYILLFYFVTNLSNWFLFLWVPVGLILGLLTLILVLYIYLLFIGSKTKNDKPFKHFMLHDLCHLVLMFCHVKVKVVGKENIPDSTYVVYANHKSNLDPVMIAYAINRRPLSAVGKKSLFQNHLMKLIGDCFEAVVMNRDDDREAAKTMVSAIKKVKNGVNMIIFPEGGIKTRDVEEMVNLRAGAYKLAMKAGADIVPCAIIGSSVIKKTSLLKRKKVIIKFFKPIKEEEYKSLTTTDIGLQVEKMINEAIKENETN